MRLSFAGTAGGVRVIQSSTNLLDWKTIGVAVDWGIVRAGAVVAVLDVIARDRIDLRHPLAPK